MKRDKVSPGRCEAVIVVRGATHSGSRFRDQKKSVSRSAMRIERNTYTSRRRDGQYAVLATP